MNEALERVIGEAAATALAAVGRPADVLAVGWGTVDTERAAQELGLAVVTAAPDVALGAACWLATRPDRSGGPDLVLLEPVTEGRLAAGLARDDEGPIAAWLQVDTIAGLDVLPLTDGPFGPATLLRPIAGPADRPSHGRFVFLVRPDPGTIRR